MKNFSQYNLQLRIVPIGVIHKSIIELADQNDWQALLFFELCDIIWLAKANKKKL